MINLHILKNNNLLHKCNPHKERLTGRTTEIYTGLSKNGTLLVMEPSILQMHYSGNFDLLTYYWH